MTGLRVLQTIAAVVSISAGYLTIRAHMRAQREAEARSDVDEAAASRPPALPAGARPLGPITVDGEPSVTMGTES